MSDTQKWYVIKEDDGSCKIVEAIADSLPEPDRNREENFAEKKYWGPFPSAEKAIAARVGLIRAGKCKPV